MAPGKANDANGIATWQFTWTAPQLAGTYTLYGAGNSVDHDGSLSEDRAASATFTVTVGDTNPTSTPVATSIASSTPTPTATATISPTISVCAGDCDASSSVSIDEIVLLVRLARGEAQFANCRPGDTNGDGTITIDEVLTAISAALNGCSEP